MAWEKAVEMGRYYGSEALRNPKLQKKALDYALDKLNPMIQMLVHKLSINSRLKSDQKRIIKLIEKILMVGV